MKFKRLLTLLLVVCMLLSAIPTGLTAFAKEVDEAQVSADADIKETAADVEVAETGKNLYGLAENVQDGQILQCWVWSYNNITANLQKIAEQGFSAIQVSPIQPIKESTREYYNTLMNSSWVIYQPVAFSIEDNYRNAQGTKVEFEAMCEEAHKYGIKVIVDTVFNHMANDMSGNTIHPWIPSEIRTNSDCWHDISKNIYDYDDRYEATQYCITGLPDLNTANPIVQSHCKNFMEEAISAGADGFRFDAVKHIETPSDSSSIRSDFWPNVLNHATEYAQETRGFTPYYYGELLGSPGDGLSVKAYTQYMSVSDPGSSDSIRNGVCNGDAKKAASGSISNGAAKDKVVQWTETHDNHKDNGTDKISEHNINKTWAMIGAKDEVCALYLARPEDMEKTMMGDADITSWSYPEVRAVNRFKNAFIGKSEYLSYYNKLACVERGSSGMIIVNTGGSYFNGAKVPVHQMANGTYEDAITGNTFTVSGGYITGDIGDTGIAVVYNADSKGAFTKGEITDFSIAGTMNDWDANAHKLVAKDANTATVTMFLPAGTYNFKLTGNGLWYGNKGIMEDTTTEVGWTVKTSVDENCTLNATGGKYTFTFNITTGKLVVMHEATSDKTSTVFLMGTFNDWAETNPMSYVLDENTVETMVNLSAGTYTFKIYNGLMDSWYSNSGTIKDETDEAGWTMSLDESTKCTLVATGGTYVFTYDLSTNKLVVTLIPDGEAITYTVMFLNWDGTVLSTQEVEKGKSAVAPTTPTRAKTAQYTYTFKGWDKDFSNITSDEIISAQYTQVVNKYAVTFLDWDNKVLYTTIVEYGSPANVPPVEPTREGYTFKGWDKDISFVTGNMTVFATYTSGATYLKGTFNNWEATNIMTETSDPAVVSARIELEAGEYTFKIHSKEVWYSNTGTIKDTTTTSSATGWSMKTGVDKCTLVATGGMYTFNFNTTTNRLVVLHSTPSYIVTFKNWDGSVLSTQEVEKGASATAPTAPKREATAQYTYTFKGWDKAFTNVTQDLVVTALFDQKVNTYTVTFKNYDGEVLKTQTVEYGASATAPTTPTRAGNAQYTYTFKSWDKAFNNVTKDTVVTALFNQKLNTYTVTFKDYNDAVLGAQTVEYGKAATAPNAPTRDGYKFTGWDKSFDAITENTVVTAQYTKNPETVKTGKLRIDITGGSGFRISVNNGAARPQGTYYVNSKMPIGATVTVVANKIEGVEFLGWMNESGAFESVTDTYTFTTTGNDYLKAVYKSVVTGVNTVIFKNSRAADGRGQIIDMQYYAAGDEILFPANASLAGYDFAGWNLTVEQIQEKLSAGEDVIVDANFTRSLVYIDITVNGGTALTAPQANGKYLAYGGFEVKANTAPAGKKFSHWADATGKIMSYDETYKSYPAESMELTAVFVASNAVIDKKPLVFLAGDPTIDGEKITYTMSWDIDPSIGTVTSAGLVAVDKNDYNEGTFWHGSGDSKIFDRALGSSAIKAKNTTSINLSSRFYDHTYYAVTFVTYTDAVTGESITIYSDMIETYKPAP